MRTHWDRHAATWDGNLPNGALFRELRDVVLEAARPDPSEVAADLGSGSGFLTLPLLERSRRVFAVDSSSVMLTRLREHAEPDAKLEIVRAGFLGFSPSEPLDVIVSNYALHHLRHAAKRQLLSRSFEQLRPGGRMVVSDIMVPLTLRRGQSAALWSKVRSIARKGIPGYWRIAKNVVRWVLGTGEYPQSVSFWVAAFGEAGFVSIGSTWVGKETGVVWGTKPMPGPAPS